MHFQGALLFERESWMKQSQGEEQTDFVGDVHVLIGQHGQQSAGLGRQRIENNVGTRPVRRVQ